MKKQAIMAVAVIAATTVMAAPITVTNPMDDLSGWNVTDDWSAAGGIAQTAVQGAIMTMQQGVPAPVDIGDYVSAEIIQRATYGSVGHTNSATPNQYSTRIALIGDAWGGSGVTKSMWSRRNPGGNGDIWGAALSSSGGSPGWKYTGWNNQSELGIASTVNSTSDWFTAELVITKTAATEYDVTCNYYDAADAVVHTETLTTDLGDLASAATWYLNMGAEYQMNDHDITLMEVDSATLYSSIPEPATLGLMGMAGLAIYARRRFKK